MNGLDVMMYDRFIGLSVHGIGEKILIYLNNHSVSEGTFFSIDPLELKFIVISSPKIHDKENNEWKYEIEEYKKIMLDDILYIRFMHKNIKQFAKNDFLTDVDISKKTSSLSAKKNLVQYKVEGESDIYFGNLDEENMGWDQFELNKSKFNVATSYDEKHYTTLLDLNQIPVNIKLKAEIIAKEILENDKTDNIHLKEERGLINQTDGDEEEKYSTVLREELKDR